MSSGIWLAMCRRERAPSIDQLVALWSPRLDDATMRKIDETSLVVTVTDDLTGNTAQIDVVFNDEPLVAQEAADFADLYGADRPDHDEIARMDARFELSWDLDYSEETYNAMFHMAVTLRDGFGAVTLDMTSGEFL